MRRGPVKRDPVMRKVGKGKDRHYVCARPGCDVPLNETTVKNLDPFCSGACAREFHDVEILQPFKGQTVGSSS